MFSGIIKNIGKIKKIIKKKNNCELEIVSKMNFTNSEVGSSISCSGVCLTLEKIKNKVTEYYLSKETLSKSIFKSLKIGDVVNLEKSLKFGTRISGHFVQGHVDTTCKIKKILIVGKSWIISFHLHNKYKKYVVEKGSITINGVSLTIAKVLKDGFEISLIPHTLKLTNLILLKKKQYVNVEFDIVGKYINNYKK